MCVLTVTQDNKKVKKKFKKPRQQLQRKYTKNAQHSITAPSDRYTNTRHSTGKRKKSNKIKHSHTIPTQTLEAFKKLKVLHWKKE